MIITFFGHSNYTAEQGDEQRLLRLIEEVSKGEAVDFYLGDYGNFDTFAKNCAKKYQAAHPNAKLVFISPYLNKWLDVRKDYFQTTYDEIIFPEIEKAPPKFAILKRNEWMIKQADYVFAYVEAHYGGAYQALLYAHKHKKPYTNLYKGNYELY